MIAWEKSAVSLVSCPAIPPWRKRVWWSWVESLGPSRTPVRSQPHVTSLRQECNIMHYNYVLWRVKLSFALNSMLIGAHALEFVMHNVDWVVIRQRVGVRVWVGNVACRLIGKGRSCRLLNWWLCPPEVAGLQNRSPPTHHVPQTIRKAWGTILVACNLLATMYLYQCNIDTKGADYRYTWYICTLYNINNHGWCTLQM